MFVGHELATLAPGEENPSGSIAQRFRNAGKSVLCGFGESSKCVTTVFRGRVRYRLLLAQICGLAKENRGCAIVLLLKLHRRGRASIN